MRRILSFVLAAVAALTLAGTSLAGEARPEPAPALQGYCPVAYGAMGKALKGDPKISLDHEGHRYLFANADARKMFQADPAKYTIAWGGWCATAAGMNQQVKSDPTLFVVDKGITYLFSSAEARKMFQADPASHAYRPAYDGWCATALSMGKKVKGDPGIFSVREGTAYLFSSADALKMFEADPAKVLAMADQHWAESKR